MADADRLAAKKAVATANASMAPTGAGVRPRGGDGDVARAGDAGFGPRIVIPAPKSDRLVLVAAK